MPFPHRILNNLEKKIKFERDFEAVPLLVMHDHNLEDETAEQQC